MVERGEEGHIESLLDICRRPLPPYRSGSPATVRAYVYITTCVQTRRRKWSDNEASQELMECSTETRLSQHALPGQWPTATRCRRIIEAVSQCIERGSSMLHMYTWTRVQC